MKVLFIYGAPAVGKLTVANEIARLAGYKVFHNHLSIDCIVPIFEFGSKPFERLVRLIRFETITEAVRQNVNIIFTFCYARNLDDPYVRDIVDLVESNGGEVCFSLITCDREKLAERVVNKSRKKFRKVKTVETLNSLLDSYDLVSKVNGYPSFHIDNTDLNAKQVAKRIIDYFELRR